jgi:putative ribosome biogenesis GTPase RsgA
MISRSQFERVVTLIEGSGASELVEGILRPAEKGGRPRQISFAIFLAAIVVAATEKPNLSLTNVHKVLTVDLARSFQISLGIIVTKKDGTQHTLTLRQVRYMLEAFERKLAHTQG